MPIDETTPTWSGPCWATIVTGTGADGHGITSNDLTGHRLAEHPDFVTVATRAGMPTLLAVSAARWSVAQPLCLARVHSGGPSIATLRKGGQSGGRTVNLDSVDTPALLVDDSRLDHNVRLMAQLCQQYGKSLRPHIKTHKTLEIARRQRNNGAVGLTVAKLGEAEVYAAAGFDDLLVCYPIVGPIKLARLAALAQSVTVSTVVDNAGAARDLSAAMTAAGVRLDVLVKLDVGMHRVGVAADEVEPLAAAVAELPGLRLRGICIHEGSVYGEADPARRRAVGRDQVQRLVATAERLRDRGLTIDVVSCGSTPSLADVIDIDGLTEVRPGNYVFYDAMQVALGVIEAERCALSVLTTVVSRGGADHAIVDAGAKTLSLDRGAHGLGLLSDYGRIIGRDDVRLASLSEEHGWLKLGEEASLSVGERLRVLPNHACAVVNNFDKMTIVRDGEPVGEWDIAARGQVT